MDHGRCSLRYGNHDQELAYAMALTGKKPWMIRKILDAQRSI